MTVKGQLFRAWLRENNACKSGRRFAAGRPPFAVLTDPRIPTEYLSWYLGKLDLLADFTSPIAGIAFDDLSIEAKWRLITKRLRESDWRPGSWVAFRRIEGDTTESHLLSHRGYVPIPTSTLAARGERVYLLNTTTRLFYPQWMKR